MFFGDTRDLFKYDLVRHVMKALPLFDSFTFVPMLSGDDEPAHEKRGTAKDLNKAVKTGRAGSQNNNLLRQMQRLQEIDSDLEYFREIKEYFGKENILVDIPNEKPFTHKDRAMYFRSLLVHFPKKTLLFLDPDIGLEESRPSTKHLLFSEVKKITDTMDNTSVLMIYQHFPREKHDGYVRRRCQELNKITGIRPITITDNEVVFFFIVKTSKMRESLDEVLDRYANTYPAVESFSCH